MKIVKDQVVNHNLKNKLLQLLTCHRQVDHKIEFKGKIKLMELSMPVTGL